MKAGGAVVVGVFEGKFGKLYGSWKGWKAKVIDAILLI